MPKIWHHSVVRGIGGLKDTVIDVTADGYGFVFADVDAQEAAATVERALAYIDNPQQLDHIRDKAMELDFHGINQPRNTSSYITIYLNNMSHKVVSIVLGEAVAPACTPLTDQRSKPAVPIAGKYRLVDIPISNCLNSGYNKIFVLTQFNSASLNKHIKNSYNFSVFSKGFVDILAAEQTSEGDRWFEGTADGCVEPRKPHQCRL